GVRAGRLPAVEVHADRVVAPDREPADDLLGGPVVAGHVVDHHHPAAVPTVHRARGVGLDLVVVRSPDADRLGEHGVVAHAHPSPSITVGHSLPPGHTRRVPGDRRTHPFDLSGKTAVVTGGGLGRGMTLAVLEAGADVVSLGRSPLPADLTDAAAALGRHLSARTLDLADSAAITATAEAVLADHRVDILVNNAGVQERHPAAEFPLEAWDRVVEVNLRAVFQLCRLFGTPMLERGSGAIVNVASLLSFQGGITVPAYAASKGGVAQLTKALCNEWAGRGV